MPSGGVQQEKGGSWRGPPPVAGPRERSRNVGWSDLVDRVKVGRRSGGGEKALSKNVFSQFHGLKLDLRRTPGHTPSSFWPRTPFGFRDGPNIGSFLRSVRHSRPLRPSSPPRRGRNMRARPLKIWTMTSKRPPRCIGAAVR